MKLYSAAGLGTCQVGSNPADGDRGSRPHNNDTFESSQSLHRRAKFLATTNRSVPTSCPQDTELVMAYALRHMSFLPPPTKERFIQEKKKKNHYHSAGMFISNTGLLLATHVKKNLSFLKWCS